MNINRSDAPVVVGVDGSENACDAVRWAAHEAIIRNASLRIVSVAPSVTLPVLYLPVTPDYCGALTDNARANIAVAADVAGTVAKDDQVDLTVVTDVLRGDPVRQLVESSSDASILALGLRGSHHAPLGAIGSIPWALTSRSHCPIAVINEHGRRILNAGRHEPPTVVVGVDSREHSGRILAHGFREAAIRGATLRAVHVWDYLEVDFAADPLRELTWTEGRHGESVEFTELLGAYSVDYPDVVVEQVVVDTRPYLGLVQAAEHADLLVVGSRGRGTMASITLGSTSHRLLTAAPCPLLVIR
jgi:nucleotide-binding universal stress UspA family protein